MLTEKHYCMAIWVFVIRTSISASARLGSLFLGSVSATKPGRVLALAVDYISHIFLQTSFEIDLSDSFGAVIQALPND